MTSVAVALLLVVGLGGLFVAGLLSQRPSGQALEALRHLGLELSLAARTRATGRIEGVNVEAVLHRTPAGTADSGGGLDLALRIVDPAPRPLRLGAERLLPALLGGVDVATGEPRFDDLVRVDASDPLVALSLFDGPTREAIAAAVTDGARFDGERWTLRLTDPSWSAERIAAAARTLIRAHRTLAARVAGPDALVALADQDRHAGVRHRALALLIERGIAPRELLVARAADVDAAVRHLAAKALGRDGVDALRALVRDGSRTWRVRAAATLAAQPLAADAGREAEDALLGALDDPELASQALLALARIGTARAVEPLKQAAASAASADLRRAARDVLATVRARLDPSQAGALSLAATGEAGALSEAAAAAGRLSRATDV